MGVADNDKRTAAYLGWRNMVSEARVARTSRHGREETYGGGALESFCNTDIVGAAGKGDVDLLTHDYSIEIVLDVQAGKADVRVQEAHSGCAYKVTVGVREARFAEVLGRTRPLSNYLSDDELKAQCATQQDRTMYGVRLPLVVEVSTAKAELLKRRSSYVNGTYPRLEHDCLWLDPRSHAFSNEAPAAFHIQLEADTESWEQRFRRTRHGA